MKMHAETVSLSVFKPLIERLNVGVLLLDREHRIVFWNNFMQTHSGKRAEEVVGCNLFACFPELPQKWLEKKIKGVFLLNNFAFTSWQQRPYLFRFEHGRRMLADGVEYMYQDCTFIPIKEEGGAVCYVCLSVYDVTEVGVAQQKLTAAQGVLEQLSKCDGLTGLYNRRHLEASLGEEFRRFRQGDGVFSFLLLDIDHFKQVNDLHGHLAGDQALRAMAEALRGNVRGSDIVARYGGEEFAVIVAGGRVRDAYGLGERIRQAIAALPFAYEGKSIPLRVSIGIAEAREEMESYEVLIRAADCALYQSKANGRNRSTIFLPGQEMLCDPAGV